ncbi:MAG TPA: polysaccharide deacetylase family protein [Vicinamibacterales bacterium]|nr:polysaccharide deacetylase family protein [Vicinamibacterales bacterium]
MRPALLALSLLLALAAVPVAQQPAAPVRRMVVTIDDLPYVARGPGGYLPAAQRDTAAILSALSKHGVPAVGFVNENTLEAPTADERTARVALLEQWVAAGHVLGNHTFSHPDANRLTVAAYLDDIDKGEVVTRRLMRSRRPYTLFFRHPMTHTGDTAEKKAGITQGLASRGYTIAPHTIENSDYLYDLVYARADAALRAKLAEDYLSHTIAATGFAERKARELFGRDDVPQTLLIHTMAINADHLDALLGRLVARGYSFMTLEAAMRDPAYATPDAYVGRHGPSWLFRWSRTIAPASNFSADPEVPAWVMALFQAAQRR